MKTIKIFLTIGLCFASVCSLFTTAFGENSELVIDQDKPFEGERIVGVLPPSLAVPAIVKLPELRLVAMTLTRGTVVKVVGETDGLYYIEYTDGMIYCTEKTLLRLEGDAAPQERSGYARYNACVYDNPYLRGDRFTKLSQNTALTIIDQLEELMLVSWQTDDGTEHRGYMNSGSFSSAWIQDWAPSYGGGSAGGGSSGDGGGSSGGGGSAGGGQDGGDIVLAYESGKVIHAEKISWNRDEKFTEKQATVFADGTNAYLARFIKRGEEVLVASSDKEKCLIWCDGAICRADRTALHLREDAEYTPWTGYIQPNGILYLFPDPESEGRKESTNTEVLVEDEYRDFYIVSLNGNYYCIEKNSVKSSQYWYDPSWGSGSSSGGGGGSSSGSSSSGGSSGGGQQWTEPVF